MHINCQEYWIDPQERHLGKMKECELIADKYEVEDLIISQLYDEGTYPSDWIFYGEDYYNGDEIELDAKDYMDVDMLKNYLDNLEEDEEISLDALYAAAFVKAPKDRK